VKELSFFYDPIDLMGVRKTANAKEEARIAREEHAKDREAASAGSKEGVISDSEAADLARKRLFRSGTVYTSTLGEEIDPNSLAGTRLQ